MSSNESSSTREEPLPRKPGELGYSRNVSTTATPSQSSDANDEDDTVLRPHPAESSSHLPIPDASTSTASPPMSSYTSPARSQKTNAFSIVKLFRGQSPNSPVPVIYGIRLSTLLRLLFIAVAQIGAIIAWALTIIIIKAPGGRDEQNGASMFSGLNTPVLFIHIGFGVTTLLLGILLERAIFIVRAERYRFLHRSDLGSGPDAGAPPEVGFVPWNRPNLPTYVNALGYRGTGDVEDHYIAPAPPPEYGNTRGSILLMSTLLQHYPQERPASYTSRISPGRGERDDHNDRDDRAILEDDVVDSARRAGVLEDALATLERRSPINIPPAAVLRV
ncbi:hypothetical protein BS47DRAFT_663132 [Hydnum rufescens UP504]|uniref:Uncharacterized protein n=1 Tax=Hydnum rufescens UP504 TaxID=1448309 RepID=A0A9P6B2N9_9AGAM|nr:hypothetical protein BS47DRAFT_663132 [Hydnum rufescens UP504]